MNLKTVQALLYIPGLPKGHQLQLKCLHQPLHFQQDQYFQPTV